MLAREKLEEFNRKPFQKREGSRAACFAEEKLFLLPLPVSPFELAVWKVATVQYNYHISVERMNYSAPYEYIKQQVDVRLTQTAVEIFFSGTRIASNLRLHGRPNQYSTVEEHMPPEHQAYLQWNGERFVRWAEQIGEHTAAVVRLFLVAHKVEQQGYKSCMALLKCRPLFLPEPGKRLLEGTFLHILPQPEKRPVHPEVGTGCFVHRTSGTKGGTQDP